jgi:hypothetical protein
MDVVGDYRDQGFAHIKGLIPPQVAQLFVHKLHADLGNGAVPAGLTRSHNLLKRPAHELHGHNYTPMLFFLWGLTPIVSKLVGSPLLPTYDYLRLYREGDVCRVHSDRYACEHSLSLTLDYSDGTPWDLQVGHEPVEPSSRVDDDFGGGAYTSLTMEVGDAVLYRGVHRRHGRITANPNGWSAHLFLHWVATDGPYREHAFDGVPVPPKVNFRFA